jgi:hypothetical protein
MLTLDWFAKVKLGLRIEGQFMPETFAEIMDKRYQKPEPKLLPLWVRVPILVLLAIAGPVIFWVIGLLVGFKFSYDILKGQFHSD